MMQKYISHERMTIQQIQAELEREYQRWNYIAANGCQDPLWPDGVNMNLARSHIIYWYHLLEQRHSEDIQVSLFDSAVSTPERRPIPPEVPQNYMVADCAYSDRLKDRHDLCLVWGKQGEYHI